MEQQKTTKFFVYGTLKSTHSNNVCLNGAKLLGTAKTKPEFTMYSLGGFPAVSPVGNTEITGEVWETDDQNIINRVHRLEGYTGERNNPRNWYDTVSVDTPYGEADMFIFKTAPNKSVIESGIW